MTTMSKQDEAAEKLMHSMRTTPKPEPVTSEEFPATAQTDRMLEPGAYDDNQFPHLEEAHYHASSRLSRSNILTTVTRSPAHAWAGMHDHPVPTRAMIRGSAIHTAVLEPERFDQQYVFAPEGLDRRTKAGKAGWAEFLANDAHGKSIVGYDPVENRLYHDDAKAVLNIANAVRQHASLDNILSGEGRTECSYAWDELDPREPGDGLRLRMRCRPDRVSFTKRGTFLVDLKSTENASPNAAQRTIEKYRLDFQASMYMRGYEQATDDRPQGFVLVFYETSPPYACGVYVLSDEYLEAGRGDYFRSLDIVRDCALVGEWPDYAKTATVIEPTRWFKENR